MTKFLSTTVLVTFLALGCKSQTESKNQTSAVVKTEVILPTILTKEMFLAEIMDYEKNPKEWIYKGEIPSLIDFYADWCRPCRITGPILDELAQEYAGKVKFYKVNVDQQQELASIFGVQSIPAFLFVPKNDKPTMSAGIASTPEETKAMFKKQIEEVLLKMN